VWDNARRHSGFYSQVLSECPGKIELPQTFDATNELMFPILDDNAWNNPRLLAETTHSGVQARQTLSPLLFHTFLRPRKVISFPSDATRSHGPHMILSHLLL